MKQLIPILVLASLISCGPNSTDAPGSRRLIQNKGSDSMATVALAWAERYKSVVPEVGIAVTSGGSGTGISALLNGTVDIANVTRRMTEEESIRARQSAIDPVEFIVGYDAPAFVVHETNPIRRLALGQLAEVYGEGGKIEQWSQLGIQVPGCGSDEIVRVGRQDSSGTRSYLRREILGPRRDYKLGSRDMQGSKDVVELVSKTPCAIGYTALAYAPPAAVKVPCIVTEEEGVCVVPSMQSAVDGTYSLARPLMMVTNGEPVGAVKDFVDWVQGDEGQCIVRDRGFAPLRPVSCQ